MNRADELANNLKNLEASILKSCELANRSRDEITLIAVTKNFPASDIEILSNLGIENVGENKDQEASSKYSQVESKLTWHFVGQLQRNKVKSAVKYCDYIHSVDRLSLAQEISKQAAAIGKSMKLFIQVDLEENDEKRGGVGLGELNQLAKEVSQLPAVEMVGLMAVAPLGQDPAAAFAKLEKARAEFLTRWPEAKWLSIGMSEDFEVAIKFGATHLRIGSLLLGVRPILR